MMHPLLTLDDQTEIVNSEILTDKRVKVYEKPDTMDGFHHATCYLPGYQWDDVFGFDGSEIVRYQGILESTAHLILSSFKEEEFEHTPNFSNWFAPKRSKNCKRARLCS